MSALAGKNCIVTGASRGLGARIATTFWNAGANLFLVARSSQRLAEIAASLSPQADQYVISFAADLSDPGSPERIVRKVRSVFGRLDVLVNNAGIQGPIGMVWEYDWAEWETTLGVDLLSPVNLCRLCVPWMAEQRRGKIINLSGGGATSSRARFSAYATAKCGLVRFSETLAEEVRSLGIDVNCVAPGAMDTEMLAEVRRLGPDAVGVREYHAALKAHQLGPSTLERAAALCAFLASSESDGITGKLISAVWDPWESLPGHLEELRATDVYTLRRIVPSDRGMNWGDR